MKSIIRAIGIATPANCFAQQDIFRFMKRAHDLSENEASRLKKIYDLSGIERRYSVLPDFGKASEFEFFTEGSDGPKTAERGDVYEREAPRLAAKAIEDLFLKLPDLDPRSITHLITVSCTGMYAPGLDIDIVERFGLDTAVERTAINFMGCYGAFNALKVADYICRAEPDARVLIADVELCTLHFQKQNSLDNWLANSLFADGAAAVLVEQATSDSEGFVLNKFHNQLALHAKEEMGWRIGDTGFEMRLSSKIAKHIQADIERITAGLLAKAGLKKSAVRNLAVHPGGRRILEVCQETLGFEESAMTDSFAILKDYGNMSSTTILFILERLLKTSFSGENIIAFAFGPGLTVESIVLSKV